MTYRGKPARVHPAEAFAGLLGLATIVLAYIWADPWGYVLGAALVGWAMWQCLQRRAQAWLDAEDAKRTPEEREQRKAALELSVAENARIRKFLCNAFKARYAKFAPAVEDGTFSAEMFPK